MFCWELGKAVTVSSSEHPGSLIPSGVLKEQVKEVKRVLSDYGFLEHDTIYQKEWAFMTARKQVLRTGH